jgi:hypothetical protein
MKKSEVPQDEGNFGNIHTRELCYAVDENGEYTTELTSGWDPKAIALKNTLEDIKERVANAKSRVLSFETSPVEYYMELNKMDISVLASYMGLWKWRVKRHFRVSTFNRLKTKTLQKYAEVFNITIEELSQID